MLSQSTMIRVLIADDHSIVRQGLATIINRAPEMTVIRLVRNINLGEKKMVGVFCQSYHHVKSNRLYSQVPPPQQTDFRNQLQTVSPVSATSKLVRLSKLSACESANKGVLHIFPYS
jgi:hypothetical protein